MSNDVINLTEKLTLFDEHWSPKIIAQMNDYHLKVVKAQGDFVWHSHADTDEVFIVLEVSYALISAMGRRRSKKGR